MNKRSYKFFFEDILESISKIEKYTDTLNYEQFLGNAMLIDAVIRNLEIIGEAAKNIPDNIRKKTSSIPWKSIIGLRNLVIHEYFGVDTSIVWEIISKDLPILKKQIISIMKTIE